MYSLLMGELSLIFGNIFMCFSDNSQELGWQKFKNHKITILIICLCVLVRIRKN